MVSYLLLYGLLMSAVIKGIEGVFSADEPNTKETYTTENEKVNDF